MFAKPRLLTGDTPSGSRLHLGHWIGSIKERVALQDQYDCYIIIANVHALTTHLERSQEIYRNSIEITVDYLAAGIDPNKTSIFIQSEIPALAELTYFFAMLTPFARLMRNPTLKEELSSKKLTKNHSLGFLLYPVGQIADILAFRPSKVPVGADQLPHLEMTREIAKRFNYLYQKEFFPVIEDLKSDSKRLVGIGPPNEKGTLPKMSKSLNNAIYLSDSPKVIQQKVMSMYTDPNRVRVTDLGTIKNNPLWQLHDAFNPDQEWVLHAKQQYQLGKISDVACKQKLIEVLIDFLKPMQERRKFYEKNQSAILQILKEGTARANVIAQDTLSKVKKMTWQQYFS